MCDFSQLHAAFSSTFLFLLRFFPFEKFLLLKVDFFLDIVHVIVWIGLFIDGFGFIFLINVVFFFNKIIMVLVNMISGMGGENFRCKPCRLKIWFFVFFLGLLFISKVLKNDLINTASMLLWCLCDYNCGCIICVWLQFFMTHDRDFDLKCCLLVVIVYFCSITIEMLKI
jgi:hypothetical protein